MMLTEIEVEGVGTVRRPTEFQYWKAFKRKGRNAHTFILACACGRTLAEFNRMPQEQRQAVHRAYLRLTDDRTKLDKLRTDSNQPDAPSRFQKGIHRTDEEKAEIGRKLIGVKAKLPHGHFGPWLEKEGIRSGYANECMRLAKAAAKPECHTSRSAGGSPLCLTERHQRQ